MVEADQRVPEVRDVLFHRTFAVQENRTQSLVVTVEPLRLNQVPAVGKSVIGDDVTVDGLYRVVHTEKFECARVVRVG